MKNIVIIGCGNGIGLRTAQILSQENKITGISRTENPELNHPNINFHQMDIVSGCLDIIDFPEIVDGLVYTPGSINLKPFNKFSTDDFKNDFEINVLGSVRVIQKLLPNLKKI
ncbi:SDR family NAD(P)-dependent oxidoreductase [Elizabethkingia anophelis]|uniref:SDR family NAD(P)-dependent oxidoreductase n=1 Tax=Elizabethkingia anophelis TaxID=1117645 RepID=UPI0038921D4C